MLSTVHTNDAAGAVTRLIDLGLEPFMVSSALVGVVSIRLVRVICPKCKESYEADSTALQGIGGTSVEGNVTLYRGAGCPHCRQAGFTGRTGIFEVLAVDDAMRGLIVRGASEAEIRDMAIKGGMRPIGEDGLDKTMRGITTLDEVTRVVYLPEQGLKMCGSCQSVVSQEFEYCPQCGHFVGEHCANCKRRVQPKWEFCPTCGTAAKRSAAEAHRFDQKKRGPRDTPSTMLRRAS